MDKEVYGLNYLIELSLSVVDRSDASLEEKRRLMYSLYSFAGLLDASFIENPSEILIKNGVCFALSYTGGETAKDSMVITKADGKKTLRFDRGGPTYAVFKKVGAIDSGDGPDEILKLDLFEMVLGTVGLGGATNELKAVWFIFFPYVLLLEPPYNEKAYVALKRVLLNEKLYPLVLESRYSDIIFTTVKEMVLGGVDPLVTDWYIEYVEWKNGKNDKGISRETEKYQRLLARGDFAYAFKGTEKLLDSFPDDENVVLTNLGARVSLGKQQPRLLEEAVIIAEAWYKRNTKRRVYYAYYMGLAFMGGGQIDKAENCFRLCQTVQAGFEPAELMLRGISKIKNS